MKWHVLICLFLITCTASLTAQKNKIDSLYLVVTKEREDSSKVNTLNNLSKLFYFKSNYSKADSLAKEALYLAKRADAKKGLCEAYETIGLVGYAQSNYIEALKNYLLALKVAGELQKHAQINDNATELSDSKEAMGEAYTNIGNIYSDQGNYPEALKNYLQALRINEEIGNKYGLGATYNNIGSIYDAQSNYTEALKFYSKSLKIEQEIDDKQGIDAGYGNIGNIYARQGNYSEAIKNQFLALKITEETGDKSGMDNHYCNIGNTYESEGKYPEALKNFLKSLEIAKEIGEKYIIATDYCQIGRISIMEKSYSKAHAYLDSSLTLSKNIGANDILKSTYNFMELLDSANGNYKSALDNYKMYIGYNDSLNNKEVAKKILSEQMTYEFDRKTDSIKAEQARLDIIKASEIKRKSLIANSALVILALAIFLAFFIIRNLQIERKKDEVTIAFTEKEKDLLKLEKQYVEEKLINATSTLDMYTKNMAEKNELLEQFKADVDKLKSLKAKELEELRVDQLDYLSKSTILTEEDWSKFKDYFEQVYKGYFIRLKEKLPDLTPAETRLICLTKLKLDSKQMANILGVSFDTIRITRYRLRKKLELSESEGIDDIAESV